MTFDDDIFTAALTPKVIGRSSESGQSGASGGGGGGAPIATLQPKARPTPTPMPLTRRGSASTPAATPGFDPGLGGGSDIWALLQSEYGKVDEAFSTTAYDKAAEAEYGNIQTMADQSANAASADYTNRAKQAGGSAEGAGLIKAEALVSGRREVADARMKQLQYDITQKEAARNLAADIAGKIGGLREGYLENLTRYQIAQLQSETQKDIAKQEAAWHYAQINAGLQEASWSHATVNPAFSSWQSDQNSWVYSHLGPGVMGVPPYPGGSRPSIFTYPSYTPYHG